ncbi:SDR family NAD(P)-dependent oxidoreductase [Mycolicibacterium arenosum]|uniref:SDR family NAD(P)-dependent oxidoreductase n=1 Tax=Mycolicibacterium arenosum TaxID=2952157 RepID=A0ABT1M035_9MYCO|nr:SDR family NAD(P)-dependent oxidoreductase [Mycolicibacterium sp. CAU 1645]MCP9272511.1 SDR family NAD(P)-dependent oxidoreductase [Mycolicibacterium sp. CAU 1645]
MTTTLITGANKGLGYETARQLIAAGHTVYLGCRDEQRGQSAADQLGARLVHLDVTDGASVSAAVRFIDERGGLDVLVNNAGVEGRGEHNSIIDAASATAETVRAVFDTNVFGVVRVTHEFLPLLQRSSAPVMVNVSSSLGSFNLAGSPDSPTYLYPGVAYPASKAALNMITIQLAKQFPTMRINAVEPGYTDTDLNGHTGTQTVQEGARIIVEMAQTAPDGPTGGYYSTHGPIPW